MIITRKMKNGARIEQVTETADDDFPPLSGTTTSDSGNKELQEFRKTQKFVQFWLNGSSLMTLENSLNYLLGKLAVWQD